MVDLHTHILPEIDDGAGSLEESHLLLDMEKRQGIETLVLTPHFYPGDISLNSFVSKRMNALNQLKRNDIRLIEGSETMMSDILFNYENIDLLCIKGTRYLLLELSYKQKWSAHLFDSVERLIDKYNVIPVIAHVERYAPVKKNYRYVQDLRDMGCAIQMNGDSLLSKWSRIFAFKLLKKGLIDVIASDCHNTTSRLPNYNEVREVVVSKFGNDTLKEMEHNAYNIIKNIDIR